MSDARPGEWLDDTDDDDDAPHVQDWQSDSNSGAVAGCTFGLALLVMCGVVLWLLLGTGTW